MKELKVNLDLYRNIPSYKDTVDTIMRGNRHGGGHSDEQYEIYSKGAVEKFYTTDKIDDLYGCFEMVDDAVGKWPEGVPSPDGVIRRPGKSKYDCLVAPNRSKHQTISPEEFVRTLRDCLFSVWYHAMLSKPKLALYTSSDTSVKHGTDAFVVHVHLGRRPPKKGEWRKV